MNVEAEKEREALDAAGEEEEERMSGEEGRTNEEMLVAVQLRDPDDVHAMNELASETELPVMVRLLSVNIPLDVTSKTDAERVKLI